MCDTPAFACAIRHTLDPTAAGLSMECHTCMLVAYVIRIYTGNYIQSEVGKSSDGLDPIDPLSGRFVLCYFKFENFGLTVFSPSCRSSSGFPAVLGGPAMPTPPSPLVEVPLVGGVTPTSLGESLMLRKPCGVALTEA